LPVCPRITAVQTRDVSRPASLPAHHNTSKLRLPLELCRLTVQPIDLQAHRLAMATIPQGESNWRQTTIFYLLIVSKNRGLSPINVN